MICLTVLHDSCSLSALPRALICVMRESIPQSNGYGDHAIGELGLNLGDLVPFELDGETLKLDENFTDAEIHGPPSAWEGVEV